MPLRRPATISPSTSSPAATSQRQRPPHPGAQDAPGAGAAPRSRRTLVLAGAAGACVGLVLLVVIVSLVVRRARGSGDPAPVSATVPPITAATAAPAPRPVAELASVEDARWAAETPPQPGSALPAGSLALRSGAARLSFIGWAEVILRGPARVELDSTAGLRLLEGRLTARVGERAAGFTVNTPSATLVDLGAEYGVNVEPDGTTEAHVLHGTVGVRPAGGGPVRPVTARSAARVDALNGSVVTVPFRPMAAAHALTVIDLADVIAGGDGTQNRRNAGIRMSDGAVMYAPPEAAQAVVYGDGQFHRCPDQPLVAGVFVPRGDEPDVLDPAGHTFTFPKTSRLTWYWLWAGGSIPVKDDANGLTALPTVIGDTDYDSAGHCLILMRTNKGVTFDLAALRAAHPGRRFTRFRAVAVNTSPTIPTPGRPVSEKSEFRAFVDGKVRFFRVPILRHDAPFEITVDLEPDARYLTLAATDGGDTYHLDWITLGDPRLE